MADCSSDAQWEWGISFCHLTPCREPRITSVEVPRDCARSELNTAAAPKSSPETRCNSPWPARRTSYVLPRVPRSPERGSEAGSGTYWVVVGCAYSRSTVASMFAPKKVTVMVPPGSQS